MLDEIKINEIIKGESIFCATGITTGDLVNGIKKINNKYRKINKSTNVLSFPQNDERFVTKKKSKIILGDIVISLEKVIKESKLQKKQLSDHLTHMVIHSLLHLLGFNHEKLKDFKIMKKKEINVLSKLSISSPYAIND